MESGPEYSLNTASSSSSQELGMALPSPTSPTPKRPAGRTKFKETRHPVYRGVRRRGSNGRWVCEVRVPSKRGERLWLGTHVTAEAAARAHDAAMLAMHGPAACLNFPDSARLLSVPSNLSDLADVRRAAIKAVVEFLRLEAEKDGTAAEVAVPVDGVASAPLAPSSSHADNASSSATSNKPSAAASEVSAALGGDMFELHVSGEMGLGPYYADLAEGLLLEPPPAAALGGDMFELHVSGEMGLGPYYADLAEGLLLEPPPAAASSEHGGDCGDGAGHDASSATSNKPSAAASEVSAALGGDMFELHVSGEMGLGPYYADLAEGLLLEPPPAAASSEHGGDCGDGAGHDASLWKWSH
uniref:Uncharacterized protein n=1 Tax=Avena sativa TaxID=4498 RepID=A0ACD5XUE0_AVESA